MEPETVTEGFLLRHKIIKVLTLGAIAVLLDDIYDKKIYGPAITRYSKKHFPQGGTNV